MRKHEAQQQRHMALGEMLPAVRIKKPLWASPLSDIVSVPGGGSLLYWLIENRQDNAKHQQII
jgi:hypothetical protein